MDNSPLIMIVEDSPTQAEQLKYILEEHKFNVIIMKNGKDALKLLETTTPTIIVSDIIMPEIDGFELCRQIKNNPVTKDVPVILLTSLSESVDIIKGLQAGADNFITKPYQNHYLISRIVFLLVNNHITQSGEDRKDIQIRFSGKDYVINSSKRQILNLLLSSYETAIQKNIELAETNKKLQDALSKVKQLGGLLPICASCKKIRNDDGYWEQIELYIKEHSEADFTHSLCEKCAKEMYGEYMDSEI